MVRVEKDYRFTGPDGEVGLVDLFDGRGQLVLQHFMFDPSWDRGCGSCTAMADDLSDGARAHLAARDTAFAAVSRAPYPKLAAYRQERGWAFPWYSSYGSDFNYDFHVSLDPAVTPNSYNFRAGDELAAAGQAWLIDHVGEQPGVSAFLRDGDEVFHLRRLRPRGRGDDARLPAARHHRAGAPRTGRSRRAGCRPRTRPTPASRAEAARRQSIAAAVAARPRRLCGNAPSNRGCSSS